MTVLRGSDRRLVDEFDVAMLDLDGVVYVGQGAVPAAPGALAAAREAGMRLAFVTNNAARPPAAVVEHLIELGIPATVEEVITSAQTAAHHLARQLPAGAPVLVVGTTGLVEALRQYGLTPVFRAEDKPAAVVQGYSPDLSWHQLAEGSVAIRAGAPWIATNLDATVPSPRGPLPGNGSLVAALRHATGVDPLSTGKPDPTMHAETVERTAARRPIVVGDRLDTDIEGAVRVGCPSLLVFTGVTTPSILLTAPVGMRPDFIADDVSGLLLAHPVVTGDDEQAGCGRWRASWEDSGIVLRSRSMPPDGDGPGENGQSAAPPAPGTAVSQRVDLLNALRALCELSWRRGVSAITAGDGSARAALDALEITATTGPGT